MGRGVGVVVSEWSWEGGAKPDGLVILRYQNQTLLSTRISAALFISVIVYPPTLQFVTISFFLKNARVLRRQQTISRRLNKLTVLILRLLKLTCSDNNS